MISIQMSVENYECLLRKVPKGSRVADILKNSLIVDSSEDATITKVFSMVCSAADLKLLRRAAAGMCPLASQTSIKESVSSLESAKSIDRNKPVDELV